MILFTLIIVLILPSISISLASGNGNGNHQKGMINSEIETVSSTQDTASRTGSGGHGLVSGSGSGSHDSNTEATTPTDESTEHSGSGSGGTGSHDSNTEPTVPTDESTEHSGSGRGGTGSHDSNTEPTVPTDESTEHIGATRGGSGSGTHDSDTAPTNDKGKGNGGGGGSHNDSTDSGKNGGSQGKVEITITVEGLDYGTECLITLDKVEDGVHYIYPETTVNHVAVFLVVAGGSCTVFGEDIAGYITPVPEDIVLTGIKGNFSISKTLVYKTGEDDVSSIDLDQEEIVMVTGSTEQLTATILPSTAGDQSVTWSTNDEDVATVVDGLITAINEGVAIINAKSSNDDIEPAKCEVTVVGVKEVLDSTISGFTGEIIPLPEEVEIKSTVGDSYFVPVTWYENDEEVFSVIYYTADTYNLTGSIIGTNFQAHLSIIVTGDPITEITDLILDTNRMELHVGNDANLSVEAKPEENNFDYQTLSWNSSKPYVASITVSDTGDSVTVTGIAEGFTLITVSNFEETISDSCYVQVSIDSTLTDPVYIMGTTDVAVEKETVSISDFVNVDQYETAEDVYIFAYSLPFDDTYYIKIEDKGSAEPLYKSTFEPSEHQITIEGEAETQTYFRLIDVLGLVEGDFVLSDNLSNSYFVSISHEEGYPSGDYEEDDDKDESGTPKTLVDNFKITSPVPTIPEEDIRVTVQQQFDDHIGPLDDTLFSDDIGPDVILARELDMSAEETNVDDYYTADYIEYLSDPSHEFTSKYTDEVKLIGHVLPANDTADYNEVLWHEPKETIKIGGYILLIELPIGYGSNLDMEAGEDGADLKEIHLTRNYDRSIEIVIWEE